MNLTTTVTGEADTELTCVSLTCHGSKSTLSTLLWSNLRYLTVVHLKEILGTFIDDSNLRSVYDKKPCLKTRTNFSFLIEYFLQHSNSAYPLLTKKDFSGKTTLPKLTLSTCCAIPLRRGSGTLPLFSITVFQKYNIQISSKCVWLSKHSEKSHYINSLKSLNSKQIWKFSIE